MKKTVDVVLIGALVAVVVGGAFILWKLQQPASDVDYGDPTSAADAESQASAQAPSTPLLPMSQPMGGASAAEVPPIHPIDNVAANPAGADSPAAASSPEEQLKGGILDMVGKKAFLTFLQTDNLVQRVVATVDNLPRTHTTTRLWPVNPIPGKFATAPSGDKGRSAHVLAATNEARYAPFVKFVEAVDAQRALGLYKRFYPMFQSAYVELGYPKQHFNDRLIEVIDHLLATPVPESPPEVEQTVIKGPIPAAQPWAHYVFADANLEALSSGQKMLLRVGPAQAKRLKVRLQEFRDRLVGLTG